MLTCPDCNTKNTNGAESCVTCGNKLSARDFATGVAPRHTEDAEPSKAATRDQPQVDSPTAPAKTYACPNCGTAAAEDTAFCPRCGKQLAGPEYASFGRRLGGYLIDGIISAVIAGIPAAIVASIIGSSAPEVAFSQEQVDQQNAAALSAALWSTGVSFIISFGYVVLLNANGGTWGKRMLGMRLEDAASGEDIGYGRAIIRWFIAILSGLALLIGYLWAAWDENNQTWHDKAAGSVVVRE